ncbi:MAG: sigma-54-dependent Fis family transcriptional regulator [Chitinophagaceae bacterium]|nr:sigma-54-dependent Fis family transcriptional regulator [Chitinophagaceae bacterium]
MKKILVIDDDRDMCLLLNKFLTSKGYTVNESYSGKKALEYLETNKPDLVLCDFRLEDMEGNILLKRIKELHSELPVIIITGYSDIKIAVEVMKSGARDYIAKPLIPDEILIVIERNLSEAPQTDAESIISRKNKAVVNQENSEYIFGETPSFTRLLHQVNLVAPTDYSVIIYGESGSGKEVIAHEIHRRSKRANMPFVAIDCGALSKELAASELFGHEKGSFTGAVMQKTGSFEIASGGTIFLDEIANLSYEIQISLLRVIQERKMRRVGGIKDIELDVRILIASNESLWNKTRTGKFREDLYHRFNEFAIDVPPLRERKEDILTFANHFLKQTNKQLGKKVKGFSQETEEVFLRYVWYGNLRELKNVIKRATLLCEGDWLEARYLPFEISNFAKLQFEPEATSVASPIPVVSSPRHVEVPHRTTSVFAENSLKAASIDVEYEVIVDALKKCGFNKSKAARMLNIDRKTLYNKMNQYQQLNNT